MPMTIGDLVAAVNAIDAIQKTLDVFHDTDAKTFTQRLHTVHAWNGGAGIDERERLLGAIKTLVSLSNEVQETRIGSARRKKTKKAKLTRRQLVLTVEVSDMAPPENGWRIAGEPLYAALEKVGFFLTKVEESR